jgi:hypothetical protein
MTTAPRSTSVSNDREIQAVLVDEDGNEITPRVPIEIEMKEWGAIARFSFKTPSPPSEPVIIRFVRDEDEPG